MNNAPRQPSAKGRDFETLDFAARRKKNRNRAKLAKASRKKNRK